MGKIIEMVREIAEPIAKEHSLDIWDIEYVKEAGERYLRVFIDREEGGVSIEDCESVSRALDEKLDEADFIQDSYTFEVSSAGVERQLKRESDFLRFIGSKVEVKLYKAIDGQKVYVGALKSYNPQGDVTIMVEEEEKTFSKAEVAKCRLTIM